MAHVTRVTALAAVMLVCALLYGCASTTQSGAVGAERSQLMLISSQELEKIASESYTKLRSESAKKGVLNTDAAMLRRIRAIAARLEPQTGIFRRDAPAWNWEVNVTTTDELNAFCMPGGKIMVYTGLVNRLRLTDDEIAVVLGHEIAHALREHSRERVSQAMAAQTAIGIGAALLGVGQTAASLANLGYENIVATKFSRDHESEADRIGLELAARGGYDPRGGITVWEKMQNASKGSSRPPAFLSTHPTEASRMQEMNALPPKVAPLYEAARQKQ